MTPPDRTWIEPLARAGFAAKGIVYLMLGGLALKFSLGEGGRITDANGAIVGLLREPYGVMLVGLLAAGLALYAGWRFLEAFADANRRGRDRHALAARATYALSGVVYGALATDAARLALSRPGGGGSGADMIPRTLVASPLSRWLVIAIALAVIGYGALQLWKAFRKSLSTRLNLRRVEGGAGGLLVTVCRIGVAARGVALGVLGVVLLRRAATVTGAARAGTDDSLQLIAALPTGSWLLAMLAAGLMAYGVFQFVQARYRAISAP